MIVTQNTTGAGILVCFDYHGKKIIWSTETMQELLGNWAKDLKSRYRGTVWVADNSGAQKRWVFSDEAPRI